MANEPLRISIAPIGRREISEAFRSGNEASQLDKADRRKAYRAQHLELTAWVVMPGTGPVLGKLIDASIGGVALALPESTFSAVDLNDTIELQFQSQGGPPVRIQARFIELSNDSLHDVLRFSFAEDVASKIDLPALKKAFNRRRAKRVEPDPTSLPVEVLVDPGGGRIRSMPVDLSTRGVGIRCEARFAARFPVGSKLNVELGLPERAEVIRLLGTVRNQRADGGHVRVGIEYDRGPATEADLKAVADYVQSRARS